MIIPALRYREAWKAIDWLGEAFGFEKHAVTPMAKSSCMPSFLLPAA